MSKIVTLSAQLGTPQIMNDLWEKLALQNPALAEGIKDLDTTEMIQECIQNAFETLRGQGVETTDSIADYFGNKSKSHNSLNIIGALKTAKLPNGLGVMMDKNGTICFAADDYTSEWKNEIERLKKLFTDAFLAEAVKSALVVLGYKVEVETYGGTKSQTSHITGVRQ